MEPEYPVLEQTGQQAQRIYGIASGYPDCNDADALVSDPIQKLLLERLRDAPIPAQ